jgi:acyl transferase domain-containing protein
MKESVSDQGEAVEAAETVAVIGMAGRFPKAANLEAFWSNLARAVECVRFFSPEETEAAGVSAVIRESSNYVPARAILDDPELFDASFFGINPREVEQTDPQHRLFLETAWEALEDAGCDPSRYPGLIGVFAGADVNSYAITNLLLGTEGLQTLIGNDKDYLATRVAYKLNLRGPALSVQTACSTSLVAVHLACQSVLSYQSDIALAGGVGVNFPQKAGYLYQEGGILSPDGHCRPFDAAAKGTVGGDGVGIVVLKRYSEAVRDGDRILAVIKGSAINNDGSMKVGFTAPSVEGQAEVIAQAMAAADVEPESIGYIETHGTGTQMGDPIELSALTDVFRASTSKKGFCAIGSLKSNVGHMNSAAGVGSLIKTILALRHKQIPPSLHYESPNPMIDFAESPFYVASRLLDWPRGATPRRAGVSSFGIGGTNAHVIVEEAPEQKSRPSRRGCQLLPISARSYGALAQAEQRLADWLEKNPGAQLADVAHTLQTGRQWFAHRRLVVAADHQSAITALREGKGQSLIREPKPRSVAFLFPGQGSQYAGMGRGLYEHEPVFRAELDRCAERLVPLLGLDLRRLLFPTLGEEEHASKQLAETRLTQPALFAFEYALSAWWRSVGVEPRAMIGHSVGEYVAACLAGVFSLEDGLMLCAERGRLIQEQPRGAMLAVALSEEEARVLPGVVVAAVNGPRACVVAGSEAAIAALAQELAAKGQAGGRLHTSHAFHSPLIEGMADPFRKCLARIKLSPPKIPFLSNLTGTWITEAEAQSPEYWVKHCLRPVRFAAGLAELGKDGDTVLLEVGPGNTLVNLARKQGPAVAELPAASSARHPKQPGDDSAHLLEAVGALYAADISIDWAALHGGVARQRVSLPTYPFERERFWADPQAKLKQIFEAKPFYGKIEDPAKWLYTPTWRRAALSAVGAPSAQWGGVVLVFARDEGLSAELVRRMSGRVEQLVLVRPGSTFRKLDSQNYLIDPHDFASYEKLVSELNGSGLLPRYVAHLWQLGADGAAAMGEESFERAQADGFYSLLFLAKALGKAPLSTPVLISAVGSGMVEVTGHESSYPERSTTLGVALTMSQEYSKLMCRVIDVEPLEANGRGAVLEKVIHEVFSPVEHALVAFRGAHRWLADYDAVEVPDEALKTLPLKRGGTYLITGGLGGIGLNFASYLARQYGARLVLTGRTGIPARTEWEAWLKSHEPTNKVSLRIRKLQELEAQGAEVLAFSADAGSPGQMKEVVREAHARFGRIDGVIHAAGHVGEGLLSPIADVTWDQCQLHFHSKAHGLYTLASIVPDELDFCLVTSSLASILGGLGGSAYAAANAFTDAFCRVRSSERTRWLAINWDAWVPHEGSPEAGGPPPAWARFAIKPAEGIAVLERALALSGVSQVVVSTINLELRLSQLLRTELTEDANKARETEAANRHRRPAQNNEYVAPRKELEATLAELWQALLGIDKVGVLDNFFKLGGDSLVAIQLSTRLRDTLGLELSVNHLFDEPTVAGLAQKIAALQAQATQPDEALLLSNLELVENLDDEEVQRMLAELQNRGGAR